MGLPWRGQRRLPLHRPLPVQRILQLREPLPRGGHLLHRRRHVKRQDVVGLRLLQHAVLAAGRAVRHQLRTILLLPWRRIFLHGFRGLVTEHRIQLAAQLPPQPRPQPLRLRAARLQEHGQRGAADVLPRPETRTQLGVRHQWGQPRPLPDGRAQHLLALLYARQRHDRRAHAAAQRRGDGAHGRALRQVEPRPHAAPAHRRSACPLPQLQPPVGGEKPRLLGEILPRRAERRTRLSRQ